jgi:hypothetical protein
VLLGGALFVATCFLPYYGFPGGRSVSLYDQLLVAQDGGLELGAILFLFGGIATVLVIGIVGLTRSELTSGRAFLAGAVAAWSLTWIGSLFQTASLREETTIPGGLSLEAGFWLQGREHRRGRYWNHSRGYPTDGSTRTRCAEPGRVTPVTRRERPAAHVLALCLARW